MWGMYKLKSKSWLCHLLPELCDAVSPGGEVSRLHLGRVCPGRVAAVCEGHVPGHRVIMGIRVIISSPDAQLVQTPEDGQAAADGVTTLHPDHAGDPALTDGRL